MLSRLGQFKAEFSEYSDRMRKLLKANFPASAIFATQLRYGREVLPILERYQRDSRVYVTHSIELDPQISAPVRLVSDHPESWPLIAPVRDAIDEAVASILEQEEEIKASVDKRTIREIIDEMRHLERVFQKCSAILADSERLVCEGNSIVQRWDSELRKRPTGDDEVQFNND
jgi:hypothetical protein